MKNVFHNKKWNGGVVHLKVKPPPTPRIKRKNNYKLGKDFVKIKLSRDPTSENLDLYEFKLSLFDNGDQEEYFVLCLKLQHDSQDIRNN